jgi:hypothetical protein
MALFTTSELASQTTTENAVEAATVPTPCTIAVDDGSYVDILFDPAT